MRGAKIGDGTWVGDNAVLGRQPRAGASMTRAVSAMPPLVIGKGVLVGTSAAIYAGCVIGGEAMATDLASLRENCLIGRRIRIGRCAIIGCNARIGDGSVAQARAVITSDARVEEDVFIVPGVHACNDRYMSTRETALRGPVIRRGAAVGISATLLPGVVIGMDAMVGAKAVVTSDVPDGCIVVATRPAPAPQGSRVGDRMTSVSRKGRAMPPEAVLDRKEEDSYSASARLFLRTSSFPPRNGPRISA